MAAERRARAWMAIPILLVLACVLVVFSREHGEPSDGTTERSDAGVSSGGPGASAAAGASTVPARARELDAGARARSELLPVRLSAPVVRADDRAGAGVLEARVLAFASGLPVADAEVSFAHEDASEAVRTNARGELVFAPSREGTYTLALVTADGFLPFAPEWGHSPVRFVARRGVRLEGVVIHLVEATEHLVRVVSAAGEPVARADVRVFGMESGERTLAPMRAVFVTDELGEARFVAPDGAVLEASHADHGRGRARLDPAAQVSGAVVIRLAREGAPRAESRIAGRLLGPEGEPIEGALVVARHVQRSRGDAALHPTLETTSDAEGRFVIDEADEGAYHLGVTAHGYTRLAHERVASGTLDLVLRLAREGRLRVVVRDAASGAPVAAATVIVTRATGPLTQETLAIESSYDAQGEVEVGGLPPGPCSAVAVAPGYSQSAPVAAEVRRGSAPSTVRIELGRGGSIRGLVVSAEGSRPLEGARVTLEGELGSGSSAVPLEVSALTDGAGRFTLSGATPGLRSVAIWAHGHHGRLRSGIAIREGETIDLGTIDLAPLDEDERPSLELAGIGAVLSAEGEAMMVRRVIEGGGASEAGLVVGDGILDVDGTGVVELGFAGTIERIRGPEGTWITLAVRRIDGTLTRLAVPRRRIRV